MTALSLLRPGPPYRTRPTRFSSLVFGAKAVILRARRAVRNLVAGPPLLVKAEAPGFPYLVAESRSSLWADETLAERGFQLGKNQNLRIACRALDGLVIPAGTVFSVWRHLGAPIAARGYVPGRMLKQGCMVPSVGGGLCQLSNALYDVALQGGCRIVERHSHSRIIPGSAAAAGRDATLAWNYVDLRFAPEQELRLSARLDRDSLVIRLLAPATTVTRPAAPVERGPGAAFGSSAARSCATCHEIDCFRHEEGGAALPQPTGRRVFLVDEAWPEFQAYLREAHRPEDRLGLPLDGARLRLTRYAWQVGRFAETASAPVATLRRSLALRRAGLQGAARRRADLDATSRIARSLARLLTAGVTSITVAQSYLPFLFREGHLGGRQVSVLMTRLPMTLLQARLDSAAAAYPERATLADFRAPAWLAEAEAEALAGADRIITPHAEIAASFGDRAIRLPWQMPAAGPRVPVRGRRIVFPGPTVARKGAHALRDAAAALGLEVMALGAELEGPDFWRGVDTVPAGDWAGVAAVVQPALVEEQPRRLLRALAAGIPVIATPACGIGPQPGLCLIPPGDTAALIAALAEVTAPVGSIR
jgi:hypothetical protein